jgi:hypothetical protein
MYKELTVLDLLKDIERQLDEGINSYANTTYILVLLDLLRTRLYYSDPDLSEYSKKLIQKVLGE